MTKNIKYISEIECDKERLMKYLFIKVATVLSAVKPSVMMRYAVSDKSKRFNSYHLFTQHQNEIYETLGLDYLELKRTDKELLVIFYDKDTLENAISNSTIQNFLDSRGYSREQTLDEKLHLLKTRFSGDSLSNEIGVFLGYPLEQIEQLAEQNADYAYLPTSMWKVLGSATGSLNKTALFRKIEAVAADVATKYGSTEKCIERFKTFAGVTTRTA